MTGPETRLARGYRMLLRCYPRRWRRHREEETISLLLERAAAQQRPRMQWADAVDLVGHGLEERLESALRWLPRGLRERVAMTALVVAAGLSLLMLVGEVVGARHRPPVDQIHDFSSAFISGPFLTIGVGMYLAFMTAALLCVRGHAGLSRLLLVMTTAYAVWMYDEPWGAGYPRPRLLVLVLFALLGVLASLATVRTTRTTARRLVGFGAVFVVVSAAAILLTRLLFGWSIARLTTPGNAALSAMADALTVVCVAALLSAALASLRHPGWLAAVAVTAFPLVLFATTTTVIVAGPNGSSSLLLVPVAYLLAVLLIASAHRRGRRAVSD